MASDSDKTQIIDIMYRNILRKCLGNKETEWQNIYTLTIVLICVHISGDFRFTNNILMYIYAHKCKSIHRCIFYMHMSVFLLSMTSHVDADTM